MKRSKKTNPTVAEQAARLLLRVRHLNAERDEAATALEGALRALGAEHEKLLVEEARAQRALERIQEKVKKLQGPIARAHAEWMALTGGPK
jgi:septal ring factor EnvC (AmiA/AmiB activator)